MWCECGWLWWETFFIFLLKPWATFFFQKTEHQRVLVQTSRSVENNTFSFLSHMCVLCAAFGCFGIRDLRHKQFAKLPGKPKCRSTSKILRELQAAQSKVLMWSDNQCQGKRSFPSGTSTTIRTQRRLNKLPPAAEIENKIYFRLAPEWGRKDVCANVERSMRFTAYRQGFHTSRKTWNFGTNPSKAWKKISFVLKPKVYLNSGKNCFVVFCFSPTFGFGLERISGFCSTFGSKTFSLIF